MLKKMILISLFLMVSFVVAGCNTVEGLGKDIQSAGKSIESAAN